jgi:hypothetical protein
LPATPPSNDSGVRDAPIRVVYIGSWSRSGSTLLDLMLGQIKGFVSAGEVRFLWERGLVKRQRCGCGVAVLDCPFWHAVLDEAFGDAEDVDAKAILALQRRVDGLARTPWVLSPWRRKRFRRDLRRYREILAKLYRAIHKVSGASVIVDSSKYAAYAAILAGIPGMDLSVVHLVRDSRAVAHSWTRKKALPEVSEDEHTEARYMPMFGPVRTALYWDLEHVALGLVRRLARGRYVIRDEDLTRNPVAVLGAALQRVGIHADVSFLGSGRLHLGDNHLVAGNPVRFERGDVPITPDDEWRSRLPKDRRRIVTALTWPLLLRHGFLF